MNTEQDIEKLSSNCGFHLDYSLKTCEERMEYVKNLLVNVIPKEKQTPSQLELLSNYVINAISKKEKKQRKLLTDNRMVTINKRETSFEGLSETFEAEDYIYTLVQENKQVILTPKVSITQKDLEEIPFLRQLKEEIDKIAEIEKQDNRGIKKYNLIKWLKEMRQDQYIIKDGFRKPCKSIKLTHNIMSTTDYYDEEVTVSPDLKVTSNGNISIYDPKHIALLLKYYSDLKQEAWGHFEGDLWYLMDYLDEMIEVALAEEYPHLLDLLIMKIDGKSNDEIGAEINRLYGKKYTNEYLSSLWCHKIPKLIAAAAERDYLDWYFIVVEKGKYKRCSRCGQIKLAHTIYFSKNKSSKDGLYSICKKCRNAKNRAKKQESENSL